MSKLELQGQKFGEWTALYRVPGRKWHCRCSCGLEKDVPTHKLTSGQSKQCGHTKLIDLTGQTFGEWTVLQYAGKMYWNCRCSCGVEREVLGNHLRNGRQTQCGHGGSPKRIDLTGQQFGDLTVLKYAGDKYWLCQCSCGKIKEIHGTRLRNGWVTSCGHRSGFKDLTGKRYGKLVVQKYVGDGNYECLCDCGNTKTVYAGNLRNGSTISCGCAVSAISEDDIKNAIKYYQDKYNTKPTKAEVADILGISYVYISKLQRDFELNNLFNAKFKSRQEAEIYHTLENIGCKSEDIVLADHTLLGRKEIDIYIPSHKLAIEINGQYWHSEQIKPDPNYHKDKQVACEKQGVRLIHIFEYEWNNDETREKIVNLLKYSLLPSERVYARKCEVKEIDSELSKEFLDKYHIQGSAGDSIRYGLFYKDKLLSVMTFGKPRFSDEAEYELIRYANVPGIIVVGGASKLFQQFIKDYTPYSVVQYSDIQKFSGNLYEKLGMQYVGMTDPSYVWFKGCGKNTDVLQRYQCQKQKLLDKGLQKYGDTEDDIMHNLGYKKIYNCGNRKYLWKS